MEIKNSPEQELSVAIAKNRFTKTEKEGREMRKWKVYKHTCPKGRVYIGITSDSTQRRWKGGHGYSNNIHFFRAIKKYGWGAFKHEVLFKSLTKEEALKKEIELISFYNSTDFKKGYNKSPGGDIPSELTCLKISRSLTGRKLSKEHIEKMSKSLKGVPLSDKTKKIISEGHKNNPKVINNILKLNAERKGVPKSKNHKDKISKSQPARARVINLTTGKVFTSMTDAALFYKVQRVNIGKVCRGEREMAGGFKWAYAEVEAS